MDVKHSATSIKRALKPKRFTLNIRDRSWEVRMAELGGSWLSVKERKFLGRGRENEYMVEAYQSGPRHWTSSGWVSLRDAVAFANKHDESARASWKDAIGESMWTIGRFLSLVEDEGIRTETLGVGDGFRTRVGDSVLYYGDEGFRFALHGGRRVECLDEVVEDLGFSSHGIMTESATTTTGNVATYQTPLGTRVDDFIGRYGDDEEDSGHLLKRKF